MIFSQYYCDKPSFDELEFPVTDYYDEYVSIGGKKNQEEYLKNLSIFLDETFNIFIHGNTKYHKSRDEALLAVGRIARISMWEVFRIFDSVDNMDVYA